MNYCCLYFSSKIILINSKEHSLIQESFTKHVLGASFWYYKSKDKKNYPNVWIATVFIFSFWILVSANSLKTIDKSPLFPLQGECQISFKFNVLQLREMGILDHLTCFLRNLYAGQEATVWTLCETTDWFRTEKWV